MVTKNESSETVDRRDFRYSRTISNKGIKSVDLPKRANLLDIAASMLSAGADTYAKDKQASERIVAIDREIASNNDAIQQLQSLGSNSIAIRKYVDRNIKLKDEKDKLESQLKYKDTDMNKQAYEHTVGMVLQKEAAAGRTVFKFLRSAANGADRFGGQLYRWGNKLDHMLKVPVPAGSTVKWRLPQALVTRMPGWLQTAGKGLQSAGRSTNKAILNSMNNPNGVLANIEEYTAGAGKYLGDLWDARPTNKGYSYLRDINTMRNIYGDSFIHASHANRYSKGVADTLKFLDKHKGALGVGGGVLGTLALTGDDK